MDFKNTILIMTSNIGARQIGLHTAMGFAKGGDEAVTYDKMRDTVLGELKRVFNPELLNRLDEVIVFHQLSKNELCKIVDLMLARLQLQLAERKILLAVDESAKEFLINRGFDPTSVPGRCAAPSSAMWRTDWLKRC